MALLQWFILGAVPICLLGSFCFTLHSCRKWTGAVLALPADASNLAMVAALVRRPAEDQFRGLATDEVSAVLLRAFAAWVGMGTHALAAVAVLLLLDSAAPVVDLVDASLLMLWTCTWVREAPCWRWDAFVDPVPVARCVVHCAADCVWPLANAVWWATRPSLGPEVVACSALTAGLALLPDTVHAYRYMTAETDSTRPADAEVAQLRPIVQA